MSGWRDQAVAAIGAVHASLPADASFDERKNAVGAAYPFGERRHHPYRVWLKAQREYLAKFQTGSRPQRMPLSPLERMMARARQ